MFWAVGDWGPFGLSLQLALWTTGLLLILVFPLAWVFAFSRKPWMPFLEAFFSLPLVLPPTVLGFYLLLTFSPFSPLGQFLDNLGIRLVFTFPGLVVASCISGIPFMLSPIKSSLAAVPRRLLEASWTLGKGFWQTLFKVVLPQIKTGLFAGMVTSFAHTMGEFGIILMIGGSLPGETRVVSIAIFEEVEAGRLDQAHLFSLALLLLSYVGVFSLLFFQKLQERRLRS